MSKDMRNDEEDSEKDLVIPHGEEANEAAAEKDNGGLDEADKSDKFVTVVVDLILRPWICGVWALYLEEKDRALRVWPNCFGSSINCLILLRALGFDNCWFVSGPQDEIHVVRACLTQGA
ncbi:unnamed protein product [Microthlaspi erraticum]|uniref:Uncharacterized protein n=1 Tax=Microthlaspi erraticum TaxID=1685480 RepID=A0A6D2HEJ6_9BRAS|nr:unnamed protein product [Microthlaspi erraticum]